ncbi:hypothetical protein Ancab_006194 [Ancistrocladus abbreviatus]
MVPHLGSVLGSLMFFWAIFQQFVPHHLRTLIDKYCQRLVTFVSPYIQIKFHEVTGDRFRRSEAYSAIESYLSSNACAQARRLKADLAKSSQALSLSMDGHEEVSDVFNGVKVWWAFHETVSHTQTSPFSSTLASDPKRYYKLTFHKRHRSLIIGPYLKYVIKEGKAIKVRERQRKLYTNSSSSWSHVVFEHPATFETLAMDPEEKKKIIADLNNFTKSEEFYARIGRAWKRGYLLYGPPGTGKSTMVAAMANLLGYDVYDLELTAVKDNTELRRLLIETSSKSVIVIEDIDCSLELTGQRRKKKDKEEEEDNERKKNPTKKKEDGNGSSSSKVTLSGLLNIIDGLWSSCGGEKLIVFTTNHLEKLDPALIRRGRMDKHIELSYCSYEAFKVLAKNYLRIDSHDLFPLISELLSEVKMTPADVAEHLMPMGATGGNATATVTVCLKGLIQALQLAKEEAAMKAEKEEGEKEVLSIREEVEKEEKIISAKNVK